ncbi:MAG: carbon starvation protein A [Candidatus Riflebacteria bacterium]|nr:carbon starvation protein A [Candidatus Riflebacteria bacterium]
MITFLVSVAFLLVSYHVYGAFLERVLGVDPQRPMPCQTRFDGVDFVPMPWWRVFLIQLLNIAGLGPVFGAIMGALWGPVVFLWIVLGGVFAGGVHDFVAAHISIREGGISLTGIIEAHLGRRVLRVMLVLVMVLLVMVGVLFVMGPARILADLFESGKLGSAAALTPDLAETPPSPAPTTGAAPGSPTLPATALPEPTSPDGPGRALAASAGAAPATVATAASPMPPAGPAPAPAVAAAKPFYTTPFFWALVIFLYYILATLLPIDALIGRVYPFFGAALLAMCGLIIWEVFAGRLVLPELSLANLHPKGVGIWPMMMVTVACGAISGFHATQSPMMARTLESERLSCRTFYGAMLTETFIALVWAAAAIGLFHGDTAALKAALGDKNEAVIVVKQVGELLGRSGFVLILLGVVALPVTTGDTAFRSARLILADLFALDQKPLGKRLLISAPLFAVALWLTTAKFDLIWGYFSWMNQTLSVFTLWACTRYLRDAGRNHFITLVPALFMSAVVTSFILVDGKTGFGLAPVLGNTLGLLAAAAFCWLTLGRTAPPPPSPEPARE